MKPSKYRAAPRQLDSPERKNMAYDRPFPHKEGKDPALCLTRLVGPADKLGKLRIKFISQLTIDLDTPIVWRYRAEFDERDIDIPVSSWTEWMQTIAVEELHHLMPEWSSREKVYGPTPGGEGGTPTWVEWRSPLYPDEIVRISLPLVGVEGTA